MAGTLEVSTIKSGAANTPPVIQDSAGTEVIQGCTAWVNFNGTGTVAIRDSFNVSSITDLATGQYVVNFTNNMANTNYCANVTAGGISGFRIGHAPTIAAPTVSALRITTTSNAVTQTDAEYVNVSVYGGK